MCDKHDCKIHKVYPDCVMFKCTRCSLTYGVDRDFLNHVLKGVWPTWRSKDAGVRW